MPDEVGIDSFACTFGELECRPEDIPGFADRWQALSPDRGFGAMGCGVFRKMAGPIEGYLVACIGAVLGRRGVPAAEVDRLVLATSDACLARLPADLAVDVMRAAGLTRCVPGIVSLQQCCSSLEALRYGWQLFADDAVRNVVLIAMDFTPDDIERVRSFAVFGDAVAGCLISRQPGQAALELTRAALTVDHAGLLGSDSFESRQQVALSAIGRVFGATGADLQKVTKVFGSNLYRPIALFNAMAAGVPPPKLHFGDAMRRYGHCGNADWMINLVDYSDDVGLRDGELYLAMATAPGFFACGLLRGTESGKA